MAGHRANFLSLLDNEKCTAFCAFEADFMSFRGQIINENIFEKGFIKKAIFMNQIHSNLVELYEPQKAKYECDGLITSEKGVALCVLSADCLPLLLWHKKGFIAALHSGRKGCFENILEKAVLAIKKRDSSLKNDDFTLLIAPSICQKNYALSGEILALAKEKFNDFVNDNRLDLKGLVRHQALNLGIKDIRDCGICSFDDERFFSYRRGDLEKRFVSVIALKG
ncbi:polyphenol oxidase family protein [Campylobacter troglodytis]|uniref:polyphenol oxidase family protein n=1 Tax=Campylobacter troglodytis TaxID=654363 RepID=UPI00115B2723|nr:laccase domain-containing protein [Campylobacter troglodytis]TQR53770.1 laccase [Campylobacter troglodytis]